MDGLVKKQPTVLTLTKQKNSALKFFGVATIVFGMYVVYLGSKDDQGFLDADFNVVSE